MDLYGSNLLLSQEAYPSIDFTLLDRPSSSIASAQYSTASDSQSRESPGYRDFWETSATFTTGGFKLEPEKELQARYKKDNALYCEAACCNREMPPSLFQLPPQQTPYPKAGHADGALNGFEPEELQARYKKDSALYCEAACFNKEMPPSLFQLPPEQTPYPKARHADVAGNGFEPTKTVHQTRVESGSWLSHDFWTPASHRNSYSHQSGKTEVMQGFSQVAQEKKNHPNLRPFSSDDPTPQMMNFLPQLPSDTRKSGYSHPAGNSFYVQKGHLEGLLTGVPGHLKSESASHFSGQQSEQEALWNYVRNMRNACLNHDVIAPTQTLQNSSERQREPPGLDYIQWNWQELHRQQQAIQVQQHALCSKEQQLCFLNQTSSNHLAIPGYLQGFPQERVEVFRPLPVHTHQSGNAGYPLNAADELPSVQNLTNDCIIGAEQVVPWQRAAGRPSPSVGPPLNGRIGQALNSQCGLQDFFGGGGGNLTQERKHLHGSISGTSVVGDNQKESFDFNRCSTNNQGQKQIAVFGQIPQERREVEHDNSHSNSQLIQQQTSNDNPPSNNHVSSGLVGSLNFQQEKTVHVDAFQAKKQFPKPLLATVHRYLEGQIQPVQKNGAWNLNHDQQFGRVSKVSGNGPSSDSVFSSHADDELAACLQSANGHQEASWHAETRQWKALPRNGLQLQQSPIRKSTQEEQHSLKANYFGGLNGEKRNDLLFPSHIGVHNAENQGSQVFHRLHKGSIIKQERKDSGGKQCIGLNRTETLKLTDVTGCSTVEKGYHNSSLYSKDSWSQLQGVTGDTGLPSVRPWSNLEATFTSKTKPHNQIPDTRQSAAPDIQQLSRRANSRNGDTLQLLNSTHKEYESSALLSPRQLLASSSPRNAGLRLAPPSIVSLSSAQFSGSSPWSKDGKTDGPNMTQRECLEPDAHVGKSGAHMEAGGLPFGKSESENRLRGSTTDELEKAKDNFQREFTSNGKANEISGNHMLFSVSESKADPDCNGEIINDGVMDAECMSELLDSFKSSLSPQTRAGKVYPGIFESSHEAAVTSYQTGRPDLPMKSSCLITQPQACPQQLNSAVRGSSDHPCNSAKGPIELNSPVQPASTYKPLQPQSGEDKLLDQDRTIQANLMQSSQLTSALTAVRTVSEHSLLENHPQAIYNNTADGRDSGQDILKAVKIRSPTNLAEHLQQPQDKFVGIEVAALRESSKQSESVSTYSQVDGQPTTSRTSLQDRTCDNCSQGSKRNSAGFIPPCSNAGSGETTTANSENKSDLKPPLPGLKRKRELIPWRITISQQARPLPSTSGAEQQSSVATARDDGGGNAQDSVLRAKQRLKLSTQLMQHVVSPLPAGLMRSNAADERAYGICISARSALEEACRLALSATNYGADFMLYTDARSSEDALYTQNLETAAQAQVELFKDFKEQFTQLKSNLNRLENSSALQFARGSEEEEKLAILDRLAPRRYVTASPMPTILPESQHVVSL